MYVLLHDREDLSGHSLSSFQPAKCSSSDATSDEDDDDENSDDDDSVSPSEIHDVIEDAKSFRENLNRHIEQTESFLNAEQISKQESVEQVGGEVNTSKNTPSDCFYEEYEEE